MFEWKVEDMALMNERSNVYLGNEKIYSCEHEISREDKIAFVDSMQDGALTYILELAKKFEEEKETLKKDQWGYVKTVSLKAWLRKNDIRSLVDRQYTYGRVYLLMTERNIKRINGNYTYNTYKDYVDEMFHRQLKKCEREERAYFLAHDEYSILKKEFREKSRKYDTTFGVHCVDCSSGALYVVNENPYMEREITIDELKELLSKYEQLDKLVERLTEETNIVY